MQNSILCLKTNSEIILDPDLSPLSPVILHPKYLSSFHCLHYPHLLLIPIFSCPDTTCSSNHNAKPKCHWILQVENNFCIFLDYPDCITCVSIKVLVTFYTATLEWAVIVATRTISSISSIVAAQGLVQRMVLICVEQMNK